MPDPPSADPLIVTGTNLRRPVGVYAHLLLHQIVDSYPAGDWNDYLDCLYDDMLANPAVSGLQLGVHWDDVSLGPDSPSGVSSNDWSYVTDAFQRVAHWNSHNATQKSIQLIVTPGFDSPQWLLDSIPSCDGLFSGSAVDNDCGTVTVQNYAETPDGDVLPLPWNQKYLTSWTALLNDLNTHFGANQNLTSIVIGGPSAATTEMFMPNDINTTPQQFPQQFPQATPNCTVAAYHEDSSVCCTPGTTGCVLPTTMWETLIEHHYKNNAAYWRSDLAFIDAWTTAINTYERIFANLTLVLTPADGINLVNFPSPNFTPPTGNPFYTAACAAPVGTSANGETGQQSCGAISVVIAYLQGYPSAGQPNNGNGKGVQISGLTASNDTLNTGDYQMSSMRMIAATTASASPYDQIIGGAQFDHAFTNPTEQGAGCFAFSSCGSADNTTADCSPTFEENELDVLATFFSGTTATMFGVVPSNKRTGAPDTGPLNFLQVAYSDVQYAEQMVCSDSATTPYDDLTCHEVTTSAQTWLDDANTALYGIAEPGTATTPPPPANVVCPPPTCVAPQPPPCDGACGIDEVCLDGTCHVLCSGSDCY